MTVELCVRLFASLRERAGAETLSLTDLPDGIDVAALKRRLEERYPELGPLSHVRGVVGTDYVPDDRVLAPGDEVSLLPPVSGGAPEETLEQGRFELRSEPLDPEAARRRVAHPSAGAIVVFTGTTRDRNRGEEVTRLDYEAFEEMAGAEMARIFEACNARFGPASASRDTDPASLTLRMLCMHRTGSVGVGEPSVVIAVASPHRDAAFAAARFLIDELKKSVPLWKKECYAAGHHWIGDRS